MKDAKNYEVQMMEDITNYLKNENEQLGAKVVKLIVLGRKDEAEILLNDELFAEDSITGNGSGSYFGCNWKSKEQFVNYNGAMYLDDAISSDHDSIDKDALLDAFLHGNYETLDVYVRCFLLGGVIAKLIDDLAYMLNNI